MALPEVGPIFGNISSYRLSIGGGVAIFHLASSQVVVCYHTVERQWFLPKGRRDVNEGSGQGAEREGFEEVCPTVGALYHAHRPDSKQFRIFLTSRAI